MKPKPRDSVLIPGGDTLTGGFGEQSRRPSTQKPPGSFPSSMQPSVPSCSLETVEEGRPLQPHWHRDAAAPPDPPRRLRALTFAAKLPINPAPRLPPPTPLQSQALGYLRHFPCG